MHATRTALKMNAFSNVRPSTPLILFLIHLQLEDYWKQSEQSICALKQSVESYLKWLHIKNTNTHHQQKPILH